MTPELESGISYVYVVRDEDSVHALADRSLEFQRKPNVMRSGRLIELCELVCMEAMRPHMASHECTLGVSQYVDHCAPIPIGATVTITARCVSVEDRGTEWHVEVHDQFEVVGSGVMSFAIVDQAVFENQRVRPKQATRDSPAD